MRIQELATVAVITMTTVAMAEPETTPITSRDYAIELYSGAVLGASSIVGMGGTSAAVATGSAGALTNPAAIAVWPTTSTGSWDWDFHFQGLNRLPGEDIDNNGIEDPNPELTVDPYLTVGVIGRWGIYSLGINGTSNTESLPSETSSENIDAQTSVIRFIAGVSLFRESLAIGVGLKTGRFVLSRQQSSNQDQELFGLTGTGVEAGAVWSPPTENFRVGASVSTPISGDRVETESSDCDPMDCAGYILPERVVAPWQVTAGAAWRFGPTRWNQKFGSRWRDERTLTVAFDAVVTGASDNGHGLGAFAQRLLQESGRATTLSIRAGAEYEWLPGRLRVRGGSYWEPSRFEGVSGRLHGTVGIDARVYTFCFWESRYRLMAGATFDGADGYSNAGVSVGFWH